MKYLKTINSLITFVLELVMIGTMATFGYKLSEDLVLKWVFAVIIPLAAVVLWGRLAAPRSRYRLVVPYVNAFRLFMFAVTALMLYEMEANNIAAVVAIAAVVTQAISYASH